LHASSAVEHRRYDVRPEREVDERGEQQIDVIRSIGVADRGVGGVRIGKDRAHVRAGREERHEREQAEREMESIHRKSMGETGLALSSGKARLHVSRWRCASA
jgi:hypothetical protein